MNSISNVPTCVKQRIGLAEAAYAFLSRRRRTPFIYVPIMKGGRVSGCLKTLSDAEQVQRLRH